MVRMRFHASARRLSGNAAATVDSAEFLPAAQLREWHEELDRMGLRATGSPAHERYIEVLIARLERAGVGQVHTEPVPIRREDHAADFPVIMGSDRCRGALQIVQIPDAQLPAHATREEALAG